MKLKSLPFLLLAGLTLLTGGIRLASAQTSSAAPSNAPGAGGGAMAVLSPEERSHLRKVQKQVLAADPDLKAEDDSLHQQRQDLDDQGNSASPDARKALMAKWHDHAQKLRDAALKLDPTLAPIYAKIDAYRKAHPMNPGGNKPAGA